MLKIWITHNKGLLGIVISYLMLVACVGLFHNFYGERLVRNIYNGQSFEMLNNILQGRDVHPVEHYIEISDRFMKEKLMVINIFLSKVLMAILFFNIVCSSLIFERVPIFKSSIKRMIFIFPLVFVLYLLFLKVYKQPLYDYLVDFEREFERIQSAAYFVAASVALLTSFKFWSTKRVKMFVAYVLMACMFLFICFDEMSWGQKFISFDTTEFFMTHNVQREVTIHNLSIVQPILHYVYVLVGFYGSFFRYVIPKNIMNAYGEYIDLFVPGKILSLYFLSVFIVYGIFIFGRKAFGEKFMSKEQEPAELLLAVGFLFFTLTNYYCQNFKKSSKSII